MSAYGIVPSDLNARLSPQRRIELTDSETAPTGMEDTALTQATIDGAEVKFHQAAGIFYELPVVADPTCTTFEAAELPKIVRRVIIAIAAYDLMALKPELLENSERALYWSALNKESLAFLDGLQAQARTKKLPGAAQRAVPNPSTGGATVVSCPTPMTSFDLREY